VHSYVEHANFAVNDATVACLQSAEIEIIP